MYNGVGVRTARGTGTNGYVQKNFASLPSSKQKTHYEKQKELAAKIRPLSQLGPDKDILEHDRKRQIESRLMAWADEQGLLDSDKLQEEIDTILNAHREIIADEFERQQRNNKERELRKNDSTHRIMEAKARQHAQLGSALGVSSDYKEGQAFDRELQEARRQQRLEERLEQEKRRRADEKDREKRLHEREEERHNEQQARIRAKLAEIGGGRDNSPPRLRAHDDNEDAPRREKRKRSPSRSRSRSNSRGRSPPRSRYPNAPAPAAAPAPKQSQIYSPSGSPPRREQQKRLSKSPSGSPPRRGRKHSRSVSRSRSSSSSSKSRSRSRSRSASRSGSGSDSEHRGRKRVKRD